MVSAIYEYSSAAKRTRSGVRQITNSHDSRSDRTQPNKMKQQLKLQARQNNLKVEQRAYAY